MLTSFVCLSVMTLAIPIAVKTDGSLQIRLIEYGDKTLTQGDGDCCHMSCFASCGNYFDFTVCLYRLLNVAKGRCLHRVVQQTGVLLTQPNPQQLKHNRFFSPEKSLGNGLYNPLSFPFTGAWPGFFELCVDVWNNYTNKLIAHMEYDSQKYFHTVVISDIQVHKVLAFSWKILCSPNFYRDDCSVFCAPRDDVAGHYNCSMVGEKKCLPGWSMPQLNCNIRIDECLPQPCEHDGSCVDSGNGFTCSCLQGYTGTFCQTDIDDCIGDVCHNGGICIDGVNSYDCDCAAGYGGLSCEFEISECASSPCVDGALCVDTVNGYTCVHERNQSSTYTQDVPLSNDDQMHGSLDGVSVTTLVLSIVFSVSLSVFVAILGIIIIAVKKSRNSDNSPGRTRETAL